MIISYSKSSVMLAPWKTARQTCHASLEVFNESKYNRFFHFNSQLGRVVHQHVTLGDFLALPEAHLGYQIAAFVRNPYDRAYSGFIQIQRDFQTQPQLQVHPKWIGDLIKTQISENMARVISAGFDFDEWICALPEYVIYESGRNTNMPLYPAHYWTHVNGRTAEFIGKVENFEADFSGFFSTVGIDEPAILTENVTDPGLINSSSCYRYSGKMSRRSLDRINDLFTRDVELFEYEKI